ncbi:MAG TPA: glycosyltransferase family 4 protein [Bryobacteraceae bacterium]|nr:glycosyltransferase family 4 protein [Bryobacteraceae bacterium]
MGIKAEAGNQDPEGGRKSALILAPEAPYPLAGGGALRTASLLHYLARTRPVDLILFRQPGAPDPAALIPSGLVRRASVIQLPATGRGELARALRNTARMLRHVPPLVDRFAGFQREVANAIGNARYEIGLTEHSWCAPYWEQIAPACQRTVLDLHNIESTLHARCAEVEGPATAFAHRIFRDASLALEREWLPRFSRVLATSAADAAAIAAIVPAARVTVYPNAMPAVPEPRAGDEEVVAFSGNMEYHPNISAVRFFRGEIWPLLRQRWPRLVWRLVGKNPAAVSRFTSGDPRIEAIGEMDDAVRELARARVAVVPLLAGSGTRFKILEAWAAGLPVVSTTVGAEGLPARDGENLLLADGAVRFASAVTRLLEDRDLRARLAEAGRRLLIQEFTWEAAWKKLDL